MKIGIVGGCGHVGLPLGIRFAERGANVTLIDAHQGRIEQVLRGEMPFQEEGADQLLPEVLQSGRLQATTRPESISDQEVVVVTIGTPVDEFLDPGIRTFDRTMGDVLAKMTDGQMLVLRSTVFPGVTQRLAERAAAMGLNIDVAHCPERIAQGYALRELTELPQVVGGVSERATERAADLFRLLGAPIVALSVVEAELAKLFANAYRYINFAISNQFYVMANRFGADFSRIHQAVTQDYPRLNGFAKSGFAGGPCLLKDTMQLAAFNHNAFALGHAAMMVNEGLPSVVVELAASQYDLSEMTAVVLGMAFKANSDDKRDSLAYKLRKVLTLQCKEVLCTDPHIQDPDFVSLEEAVQRGDIFFVGACHDAYKDLSLDRPVIDPFHFVRSNQDENPDHGSRGVHRRVSGPGTAGPRALGGRPGQPV